MKLCMDLSVSICGARAAGDVHLRVHLPLDPTPLTRRRARVQHDLRVLTSEKYDADGPARVPEHRSA